MEAPHVGMKMDIGDVKDAAALGLGGWSKQKGKQRKGAKGAYAQSVTSVSS